MAEKVEFEGQVITITQLRIWQLSELWRRRGVSVEAQAHAIGITGSALCNYRRFENEPSVKVLRSMCRYYHVSADWILGLEDRDG